jgi:hypothetical protein
LTEIQLYDDGFLEMGVTDSHGTCLAGAVGIYLYADPSFTKVALLRTVPRDNYAIARGCA